MSEYVLFDYGRTNGAFLDIGFAYPRDDAALMMNIYHRRGYVIAYMAGRPRQLAVQGKSMCAATRDWLFDNGFPVDLENTLIMLRDGDASVTQAVDRGTAMAKWMGQNGTGLFESFTEQLKSELECGRRLRLRGF